MSYWTSSGVALGLVSVAVVHWLLTRRMLAVSGAFTAIVNRLRHGPSEAVTWTEADLQAAIAAATLAEFDAVPDESAALGENVAFEANTADALAEPLLEAVPAAISLPPAPRSVPQHMVFLVALVLGGLISALLDGHYAVGLDLRSQSLAELTSQHPVGTLALLLLGGTLVGAGTRMAGGCTSGHGLCGVSRFQPGSLIATCVFFATGILTALLMGSIA